MNKFQKTTNQILLILIFFMFGMILGSYFAFNTIEQVITDYKIQITASQEVEQGYLKIIEHLRNQTIYCQDIKGAKTGLYYAIS